MAERLAGRGVLCETAGVSGGGHRGEGETHASSERPFWTSLSVCASCVGFLRSTAGADMVYVQWGGRGRLQWLCAKSIYVVV